MTRFKKIFFSLSFPLFNFGNKQLKFDDWQVGINGPSTFLYYHIPHCWFCFLLMLVSEDDSLRGNTFIQKQERSICQDMLTSLAAMFIFMSYFSCSIASTQDITSHNHCASSLGDVFKILQSLAPPEELLQTRKGLSSLHGQTEKHSWALDSLLFSLLWVLQDFLNMWGNSVAQVVTKYLYFALFTPSVFTIRNCIVAKLFLNPVTGSEIVQAIYCWE